MRCLRLFLLPLLVALALAGDADGGDPDEDMDPAEVMKELDKDGDGKLTVKEIVQSEEGEDEEDDEHLDLLKKLFKESDKDNDDKIDMEELPILMQAFMAQPEAESKEL